jgi:alkyl hydroperoxide reductase subunit F
MYDLAIIGGGPAGAAAGVYAARKKLTTTLITDEFGGQSIVSPDVQNWIGDISISGTELAQKLEEHVKAYAGDCVDIVEKTRVSNLTRTGNGFAVTTNGGEQYTARTVLITTGAHRRKLNVPGAAEYEQKGVTYCASCDAPMFSGMDVAVIGGGNAGFETAVQLFEHANSVTMLTRGDQFRADPVTVERVLEHEKMHAIKQAQPTAVHGDAMVTGLSYRNTATDEEHQLRVQGIFVEIGLIPTTGFAADIVELDENNRIKTDCANNRTMTEGIWAAGDCTNNLYHQNNIAAGDAVRALEDIYSYLRM